MKATDFKLLLLSRVKSLKGKIVLIRLTLNVPVGDRNIIENDYRLRRVLPTLKYLHEKGARTIVISHIGKDGKESLMPIVRYLHKHISIGYVPDIDPKQRDLLLHNMQNGSIFVVENIRRYEGEMKNTKSFSKELAHFAELFVNEDFAASHRSHASIVGVPAILPSVVGPLFDEEVRELSKAFKPAHPFVMILGGAKLSTKLPLVKKFLPVADKIFIVGALANQFFNELGYEIGKSLVDRGGINLNKFLQHEKIVIPSDVVVARGNKKVTVSSVRVEKGDVIVDVGPETVNSIRGEVQKAKFVVWNGPLGKYEHGQEKSTEAVAQAIASSSAYSIVGGGDTIAAIENLGILKDFNFVSTGGGAMLDFLAKGTLPGIDAILKSKKNKK